MHQDRPKWQIVSFIFFAALLCGLTFLSSSLASDPAADPTAMTVGYNVPADQLYDGDILCPHNWDGITGRIVVCMQNIVIAAAKNFLSAFLPAYEATLIAALTLAVTIFGAMMMMGSIQRPTGETFFFIFKLAAVTQFAVLFGGWIDHIFDVMGGLINIVSNYVTLSATSACSSHGALTHVFEMDRDSESAFYIWDKIDCLFITLLGIGAGSGAGVGAAVLSTPVGIVAVLSLFLFTGGIGLIIFIVAILLILMLLLAVVRAVKIYLISVMAIAFLVCVSPIFIPMILFSHTRPMFDNWAKYMANYMLIPIFLVAFLTMMVAAFDAVFFRGTSSMFYAIAGQHSQDEHFSLGKWVQEGKIGDEHTLPGEELLVGRNIPGMDAMAIMEYIAICQGDSFYISEEEDLESLRNEAGEICDEDLHDLHQMLSCAMTPVVPDGSQNILEGNEGCDALSGTPYHGFERNEEILHFAIAPNIESDAAVRRKRSGGCGWNPVCNIGKAANFVADQVGNVVGTIVSHVGSAVQWIGNRIKNLASLLETGCRITPVPGAVCSGANSVLMVAGDVVHKAGTAADFSGRVMIHGLLSVLDEMFESWFDVAALDLQKVASYKCQEERGFDTTLSTDREEVYANYRKFLNCDRPSSGDPRKWGPKEIIIDILYIIVAGLVMAWLLLKAMDKIPLIGKRMIGTARIEVSLPGEGGVSGRAQKAIHGLEKLKSPASRMRGGGS